MGSTYPTLVKNAIPQLLVFPSTWECEQKFSALMAIKFKSRNRLTKPRHDFRCAVSNVELRIDHLVQRKTNTSIALNGVVYYLLGVTV